MNVLNHFRDETGKFDRRIVFASGAMFGFAACAWILYIWRLTTPYICVCPVCP